MDKTSLGNRMKMYEGIFKQQLIPNSISIIRIDGKAFHTYTKGLNKPFDRGLIYDMDETAAYLCKNIMGAKFAYVQSDEISILVTDYDKIETQQWFGGSIMKWVSVSASMATSKFNELRYRRLAEENNPFISTMSKWAEFDSRVWQIPTRMEATNYFIWRQQDATRNSIQMAARSVFSHNECENKNGSQLQEMLFQKGINWDDYPAIHRRGRVIKKEYYEKEEASRSRWGMVEPPIFTQDREFLLNMIPKLEL